MAAGYFPIEQFFDNSGDPVASGFVYTYEPGTTTAKTAYTDQALTIAHANPIALDANGRPPSPIWLSGETKVICKTAALAQVGLTYDNMNADQSGLGGWSTKNSGVLTKTATYSVAAADDGKLIVATSGTWGLTTAVAAATMGDGFTIEFYNAGTGVIGFDPNGSETVNGLAEMLINPGQHAHIRCDGSNWRMLLTPIRQANQNVLAAHEGLIVKQASATTIDVDAAALELRRTDVTNTESRRFGVSGAINITIDSAVTGANGLDTGTMPASPSWFHIWVLGPDTSVTTIGVISLSATTPTPPTGYTWRAYVGAAYWNGTAFLAFYQHGNVVSFKNAAAVLTNGAATTYTAVDLAANVPSTATEAILDIWVTASGASTSITGAVAPEGSGTTATYGAAIARAGGASSAALEGRFTGRVLLSTAQQVKYFASGTNAQLTIGVMGFVF